MHGVVSYVKRCCILWAVFHAVHVGLILNGLNSAKKTQILPFLSIFFTPIFWCIQGPRTPRGGFQWKQVWRWKPGGCAPPELRRKISMPRAVAKLGEIWGVTLRWNHGIFVSDFHSFFSSGMTVSFATFDFWVKNAGSFLARHKKLDLAGMGWQTLAMKETGMGWWSNVGLGPDHAYR